MCSTATNPIRGQGNTGANPRSAADAAARAATTRISASRWLRSPIAAGMRARIELHHANTWASDTTGSTVGPEDFARWLRTAYEFTPAHIAPADSDTALSAMAMTSAWLVDRAQRMDSAELITLDSAAVAIVVAGAQALSVGDIEVLTSMHLPHPHAHVLFEAPVLTLNPGSGGTVEDITGLTWWPAHTAVARRTHIVDWLATDGPGQTEQFITAQARARARLGSMAELPTLQFGSERILAVEAYPITLDDLVPAAARYQPSDVVEDPSWELVPRLMLVLRHMIMTRALSTEHWRGFVPADTSELPAAVVDVTAVRCGPAIQTCNGEHVSEARRSRIGGQIRWTSLTTPSI